MAFLNQDNWDKNVGRKLTRGVGYEEFRAKKS